MNSFGDVDYSLSGIVDFYEIIYRSPYVGYNYGVRCVRSDGDIVDGDNFSVTGSYGIN